MTRSANRIALHRHEPELLSAAIEPIRLGCTQGGAEMV
jgi:hypothetical protein